MPRVRSGQRKPKAESRKPRWRRRLMLISASCAGVALFAFWLSLPLAEPLRARNPDSTALIEARAEQARRKGLAARRVQRWVPLRQISPWLQRAVVDSEDARFFAHAGLDAVEAQSALAA